MILLALSITISSLETRSTLHQFRSGLATFVAARDTSFRFVFLLMGILTNVTAILGHMAHLTILHCIFFAPVATDTIRLMLRPESNTTVHAAKVNLVTWANEFHVGGNLGRGSKQKKKKKGEKPTKNKEVTFRQLLHMRRSRSDLMEERSFFCISRAWAMALITFCVFVCRSP